MIVVIGIVIFLVGLTVTAATALVRKSEERQTRTTLSLLETALQEWELESDRKLTWGSDPAQSDIWEDRPHILIITELLDVIRRQPKVQTVLAQIDDAFVYRYTAEEIPPWIDPDSYEAVELPDFYGSLTILDAWGFPIYATHPGSLFPAGGPSPPGPDEDGTIRTENEKQYGVVKARKVCFVSAGPDGIFGDLRADPDSALFKGTQDNLYSYEPIRPEQP